MEDIRGPQQSNGTFRFIVAILVLLIIGVFGYFLFTWFGGNSLGDDKTEEYEAVFLTNGQVYFSKIEDRNKPFLTLSDIYYLRVQQNLQPSPNTQENQPSISLVKLGNELHGPEDIMFINRDHVLFIEPLKTDSNVVQAIRKDKAGL
jgi:hypothetical protein